MEIIKTDKQYRKHLFITYLIGIATCVALWKWGRPALINFIWGLPIKPRVETIELLSHFFLLLFIPPAVYLIVVGYRVCRNKMMPYPGMKVIRDTIVLRGRKAVFRGKCMIVLGSALIIIIIASMISTHIIILRFKRYPLFKSIFFGKSVVVQQCYHHSLSEG